MLKAFHRQVTFPGSVHQKIPAGFALFLPVFFLVATLLCGLYTSPALSTETERHRVIVSTDIGGTDPDDFQSMVHLLVYADSLDIEGLISSPFGPGRKQDILDVIDLYAQDYPNLRSHSAHYPSPETLRKMTKQGETQVAPYRGFRQATEGSNWIVARARANDPRPLHLLVWGGLEDLAQALHDAPDIQEKLRVYFIGGPNKKWSPDAYQTIASNFPKLHMIETNASYRGWFVGGNQSAPWGNDSFTTTYIAGRGAMGEFFTTQLGGTIKMGDTPSVGWLLQGTPSDPSQPGWGGSFVRAWERPHKVYHRITTDKDEIEEFGILELVLPLDMQPLKTSEAFMHIGNQRLAGHIDGGKVHFRFSPKSAETFHYKIVSNLPTPDQKTGAITATPTAPSRAQQPDRQWPNWWVDNPDPRYAEPPHIGVKTVNRWREDFLRDFADRMARTDAAAPDKKGQ